MSIIPWTVANDFMEHRIQQRMDHDVYGLRPNHRFFQQHPTVNDALANLISAGYITITEDMETFLSDAVVVKGGRTFDCDIFVTCTGYTFGFPYLDKDIFSIENHEVPLYKYVFYPGIENLAVIGLIQPIGSIAPISEIQSRWVSQVFSGQVSLPSIGEMENDIVLKKKCMQRRYFKSQKHTIQDEYFRYGSLKWLCNWSIVIILAGLWTFCSGTSGISITAYFTYVVIFLAAALLRLLTVALAPSPVALLDSNVANTAAQELFNGECPFQMIDVNQSPLFINATGLLQLDIKKPLLKR
uniref:Flavin-containing monooxygenase n=1 Tax=Heterorhabditis bacteriophora TaxID=37862 RepID=A0A1I7WQ75_HETBA